MKFAQLNLTDEILRAVADQGYTEPTPIQAQAIPPILEGQDIMGAAQTGTGKTAGFTLPTLNRLQAAANTSASPARHPVRALILVPTRELAIQVYESVKTYGKYLPLRSASIYGGVDMDPQIRELRAGVEILVATPGRLLDHIQQKTLSLAKVEILILDEADRMLDMGFLPDIKRILALLPQQRQSLMFSATFSEEIKKLANTLLHDPVLIEVARRNSIAELITHVVHPVGRERKRELLTHLINSQDLKQTLVFVRTKHGANNLALQLQRNGIDAAAIHGDKTQPQRTQALTAFKNGEARVLVATDVAARGLDIEDLPHVVNYELPTTPEDYIHRIGRTGRAGAKGDAISLVCDDEKESLQAIEKLLKFRIDSTVVPGFEAGSAEIPEQSRDRSSRKRQNQQVDSSSRPPDTAQAAHIARTRSGNGIDHEKNSRNGRDAKPRHERKCRIPEDPLFSQPYTPDQSSLSLVPRSDSISSSDDKRPSYFHRNKQNKPLAALFMPPRHQNKSQQDG